MRFEDVGNQYYLLMEEVIAKEHRHLAEASICILFDMQKRKTGDKYVLGRIKATNDELKAFAVSDDGIMYDYIMFLDKEVCLRVSDEDIKSLMYHELCHCKVTEGANPYKIQGHEIETFYSEIERNKDNPRWSERMVTIAASVHDPENNAMPEE